MNQSDWMADATCQAAGHEVLAFLQKRLPSALWMIVRQDGELGRVLLSGDPAGEWRTGTTFSWEDSYCSVLLKGGGPRIAASLRECAAYARQAALGNWPTGAFLGVPVMLDDDSAAGVLCGLDAQPQTQAWHAELPLAETLARLLGRVIAASLLLAEETERARRAESKALTDVLTGLYNRRGWDVLLQAEESRCKRYGHAASVVCVDLDGLKQINDTFGHRRGDEWICAAAAAIRGAVRVQDVVARIDGDEFLVLGVECDPAGAVTLERRISEALQRAGIAASVGSAVRTESGGLALAVEQADRAMYSVKQGRPPRSICRNPSVPPVSPPDP